MTTTAIRNPLLYSITLLVLFPALEGVQGWCLLPFSQEPQRQLPRCSQPLTFLSATSDGSRDKRKWTEYYYEYDDDNGEEESEEEGGEQQQPQQNQRSNRRPQQPRDNYGYYDDPYDGDDRYNNDQGYYGDDEYYEDDDSLEYEYVDLPDPVEWEEVDVPDHDNRDKYSKAYVLLPPAPPSANPLPSAVLHFVGGTFFGSLPKAFYKSLLEDIVTHTQCAIVVTPLPIITPLGSQTSALDHVKMATSLKHQFRWAFEQVLEDEYGADAMKTVPIAGLGHSLGARILVVLATMMEYSAPPEPEDTTGQRRRRKRFDEELPTYQYKSMILIGFTNFGASESIPGIKTLLQERRKLEENMARREEERQREDYERQRKEPPRRRRAPQSTTRRKRDAWYNDDYGNDEEDWATIWGNLQEIFQDQTDRVKGKLTPKPGDLEFYPSPRQLWSILEGSEGKKRKYGIPQTLLIQFDRDPVDQSSKLATLLASPVQTTSSDQGSTTATVTNQTTTVTDLKFARLRGKHLIPVSIGGSSSSPSPQLREEGLFQEWSTKTLKGIGNQLQEYFEGSNVPDSGVKRQEALKDLRQTITRYIADVVTK